MCDSLSGPCCILNGATTKELCLASGGDSNQTDPCNILSPGANSKACAATKAGNAAAKSVISSGNQTLITAVMVILGLVILGGIAYMLMRGGSTTGYAGGSRKFSLLKNLKSLRF
jgi:hypothetical protein